MLRLKLVFIPAACATLALLAQQLHSQSRLPQPKLVRGSISRLTGDTSTTPMKGSQVVLHRVGGDASGPVDSTTTNAAGEFRIPVRIPDRDSALYMLSSSHAGIAYFSTVLHAADLDTVNVELMVFDTTSAPVPITVTERHLIVFAPVIGGRRIVEVYGVANESSVTRVARGDTAPVWRAAVPRGARDFGSGPGDVSPDALRFQDGEVRLFAPLPPGMKKVTFAYTLPDRAFPLLVGMESDVEVMEVLLAERRGAVHGDQLKEEGLVEIQGQSFTRYLGFDVKAGSELRVTVPAGSPLLIVLLIVGIGMLIALAATFRRRAPAVAARVAPAHAHTSALDDADTLARRIAELDAVHAGRANSDEETRAAYTAERNQLKKRLAALLARRSRSN